MARRSVGIKTKDHRSEERVRAALPVKLGNASGITRDVSASGIFFETDAAYAIGNSIRFAVDLDTPGGRVALKCSGEIVRLEPRDGRIGVAVHIIESRLESA
ncbi:MAG: hypothetical protein A3H34_04555 [Betaproteobacteria bacterium RIFCSPLOWO2_02_FULL_67_19]|nr:MAG: hypothetical protein A3H34_04555 [Betaproteobacteria bacterium RIFCSPLOWO2_02_FULL_67_19]